MSTEKLGHLLDRMIKTLSANRGKGMENTLMYLGETLYVTPAAIYRWRQGRHKPDDENLEKLVEIGIIEAGMNQTWAEQVLYLAQHPRRDSILQRFFPATEALVPPHNLPRRPYVRLVGRDFELAEIIRRLAPEPESRDWIIPIEGIGGVGKSALALEAGWWFVDNYKQLPPGRRFAAVIWASAKREVLTAGGVEAYQSAITNLDDIYRAVADVWPGVLSVPREKRSRAIEKAFHQAGRVLLIVDNLETVDDPRVISFLRDLKLPTKAIVTMRFHVDLHFPIQLQELDSEASRELVIQECQARGLVLNSEEMQQLLTYTRGIPLAIWWAIGLAGMQGYTVKTTLERLANPQGELQQFIFDEATKRLREQCPPALEVLQALTFFDLDCGATDEALAATLNLDTASAQQARHCLQILNLINRDASGTRFTMLPLTQTFAQQDLILEWEVTARERWSQYFLDLAERCLKRESPEERYWNSLDAIEALALINPEWPNFLNVLEWVEQKGQDKTLIELVILLVHYMDRRVLHAERLYYVRKAAEAAGRLGQRIDQALLLIDGLGWTLIEEDRLAEAEKEILGGLRIIQSLGAENLPDADDLTALAHTFLARVYLQQEEVAKASRYIREAALIPCRSVVKSRVRMIAGEIASKKDNPRQAIRCYKDAIEISHHFEEGTRSEFHYRLGFAHLAAGDFAQARLEFIQAYDSRSITIESVHAKYGLAQVSKAENKIHDAQQCAEEARTELLQLHPAHPLLREIEHFVESLETIRTEKMTKQ